MDVGRVGDDKVRRCRVRGIEYVGVGCKVRRVARVRFRVRCIGYVRLGV